MTPATRAQAEDAVRVLDAVIARDDAAEAYRNFCNSEGAQMGDVSWQLRVAELTAEDHALEQIELYRARYGHTR